jgi:hypothetical protein
MGLYHNSKPFTVGARARAFLNLDISGEVLGLFFHKSALALAPRGFLQSAYDFLCLIYTKNARASRKMPGLF